MNNSFNSEQNKSGIIKLLLNSILDLFSGVKQTVKDRNKLIIAGAFTLFWFVMLLFIPASEKNVFFGVISFFTFSYGGVSGNLFRIFGGLVGKATFIYFVASTISSVKQKQKIPTSYIDGLKALITISKTMIKNRNDILVGLGIAFITYNFMAGQMSFSKGMIAIILFLLSLKALNKEYGLINSSVIFGMCVGYLLSVPFSFIPYYYLGYVLGAAVLLAAFIMKISDKYFIKKITTLMLLLFLSFNITALVVSADNTNGYWKLVDKQYVPTTADFATAGKHKTNLMEGGYFYEYVEGKCSGNSFNCETWATWADGSPTDDKGRRKMTLSWKSPASTVKPGNKLNISASNTIANRGIFGQFCISMNNEYFADESGKEFFENDTAWSASLTSPIAMPDGKQGDRLIVDMLLTSVGTFGGYRYLYTYEYVEKQNSSSDKASEEDKGANFWNDLMKKRGSIWQSDNASNYRASSFSGEITVLHEDESEDEVTEKTIFKPGDKIITGGDSYVELSYLSATGDVSTIILPPRSSLSFHEKEKTFDDRHPVLIDVKNNLIKMIRDGELEVTMNQAVAGIKSTTFVLMEEDNKSILKVLQGAVSFKSKASGQKVTVKTGQMIYAYSNGLSEIININVKEELEWWEAQTSKDAMKGIRSHMKQDKLDLKGAIILGLLGFLSSIIGLATIKPLTKKQQEFSM